MPPLNDALVKLKNNPEESLKEASRLLVKIADNILKDPSNVAHRALKKTNKTVFSKILSVAGGLDCLKFMGFEEDNAQLVLPATANLDWLQTVRNEIFRVAAEPKPEIEPLPSLVVETDSDGSIEGDSQSEDNNASDNCDTKSPEILMDTINNIPKCVLPPPNYMYSNPLLRNIETLFHMALAYDDKFTQQLAKMLIPTLKLEVLAQKRLRQLQHQVKKGLLEDPNVSIQDMLILELLAWFKEDFFKWVDNPACKHCGGKTKFSHMSTDSSEFKHTSRIEMHACTSCSKLTPFPRYNDVNILLITKSGRCGEWANTFTSMCCAMGWDARYVVDQTDHVWTEVYSFSQKRWLHCDPCENACDTPLIYEHGWGKKLSYVIAYSSEEVQDVTWRYSSKHKEIMSRRRLCDESELIDCLMKLRHTRQKNFTQSKRQYLTKRVLMELAELMVEPKASESDSQGRTSGSLAWRLTRGETQDSKPFCWTFANQDLNDLVTVKFSSALDRYECICGTKSKFVINGWNSGTFHFDRLFRKEEKDWKMAYLARKENETCGTITWKFTVNDSQKVIDAIIGRFECNLYEDGKVDLEMRGDDGICVKYETGMSELNTAAFSGCKTFMLTAHLSGGSGDVAWQHAQLFRQSTEDKDNFPFSLTFKFKNKQL